MKVMVIARIPASCCGPCRDPFESAAVVGDDVPGGVVVALALVKIAASEELAGKCRSSAHYAKWRVNSIKCLRIERSI